MNLVQLLDLQDRFNIACRYQLHRQAGYVLHALCRRFVAQVTLGEAEFNNLLVNSAPSDPNPSESRAYSMQQVLDEIMNDSSFLTQDNSGEGLNGSHISRILEDVQSNLSTQQECFIIDKFAGMSDTGSWYVIDGMHRLVAYGLIIRKKQEYVPVTVYYGTDRDLVGSG